MTDARVDRFFGTYFFQDWDAEYGTPFATGRAYRADCGEAEAIALANALSAFGASFGEPQALGREMVRCGSEWNPGEHSMQWVQEIIRGLKNPVDK